MNIAVVYRSITGHSKKIAKAIASGLNIEAQNIKANPLIDGIDLLFIVGGIYGGKSSQKMLEFAKAVGRSNVKRVALVTSSALNKHGQNEVRAIHTV